jgi:hypothetical protein
MGLLTSEMDIRAGVAYWAHVGGFAAGVAVAWFVASKRIEERFVDPGIQSKITLEVEENKDVIEALEIRATDPQQAFRMLLLSVMNQPRNHDAAAALWELARELNRMDEAAPLILRSVTHQLSSSERELALELWVEVAQRVPELRGDARQFVRLGQALLECDWKQDALVTFQMALRSGGDGLEAMLALTIARCTREIDPATAHAAATRAMAGVDADEEIRGQAQELLGDLPTIGTVPLTTN